MSVVDLAMQQDGPSEDFGRTPPQDVAAEQSVLGGMMLSKDAIADVIEVLRGTDFYRPSHELIYDAILDLYGRGEPADAVTVSAELTKRGDLGRAGGPAYLHTLISSVPTAANAGFYAMIVHERAVLRRLVEAGTKIVQLGYGGSDGRGGGDVDEIVNTAQAEIYKVTERRASEDYVALSDVIEGTIDEIEAASHRGDGMIGVPTGFADLDRLTNGLHPGQMIVLAARPAIGKALALDTAIPTPAGWTTMGEVEVGDLVLGSDGRPVRVVAATEVMSGRPCCEVHFSDGEVIVADEQHQWLTETREGAGVRTTAEIAATLLSGRHAVHAVRTTAPLHLASRDLAVPPYALGAWLGEGVLRSGHVTSDAPDVGMNIEANHPVSTELLASVGVLRTQRIPGEYLRASEQQRRELLSGLLDAAGTVLPSGVVEFTAVGRLMAADVHELVVGLGYRCSTTPSGSSYALSFATDDIVFGIERKRLTHKQGSIRQLQRRDSRFITAVVQLESVPVRCIEIDSADHLYLAGRSMVPTHNSTLGLDIARSASIHAGMASVVFSLEMSRNEITMRLLSAEARIPLQNMRKGTMRDEDWTRLARTMGAISEAPLFIDDSPNMSLMEIRAKCRRLKQRHDLKLVVIDYLQLMSSGKKVESRQQEVSEFSRALKLLAKEIEVPVIAISQLNRGPEQRTDKRPQMSDLRESGCLTADTKILRADTGAEVTMGELHAAGATDVPVWSLDDSLRYVRRHLTHVFPTGRRPVFRIQLASGKVVRATANHPFLTYEGWRSIGDLPVGSRVAVPRHVPGPEVVTVWTPDVVVAVAASVAAGFRSIPDAVPQLPKSQIAAFIRQVWTARGQVVRENAVRSGDVTLDLDRPALDGIARLLLRFGISADLRPNADRTWRLCILPGDDERRFVTEIGLHTSRENEVAALRSVLGPIQGRGGAVAQTQDVWRDVGDVLSRSVSTWREGDTVGGTDGLGRVATLLQDAEMDMLAVNDVLWDTVNSVEPDGEEEVYDATVVGNHNFVANGIAVHNSIEQDADMVILLHREDAYERESPRAGEADFIIAKHRNGPTDTIVVAFQGHYSRFVDMAQG